MKNLNYPLDYAKATVAAMMRKYAAEDLPPKSGFHYHQGVFLDGVLRNYKYTKDESWFAYAKAWVDYMLDEDGKVKYLFRDRPDDMQSGNLLYPLYERTGEQKYKNLMDFIMNRYLTYPKNKAGGYWHAEKRENEMWLDSLYMGGPIICKYAKMFNHPEYYDIPATQALLMQKMTLDKETGLMYHAYDEDRRNPWADPETGHSPEFWGRSIGWVPVAIMEELDYISEDHPKYQDLCDMVRNLLISLCKFQSEEGRWYQVVNKGHMPDNWLENSCSCLYTAALCAAVRKGILDKAYLENAKKGYRGVINSLTWEGDDIQIGHVCIGTGVGNYEHYINRPVCTNDLHGVGAFLIMCAEMQAVWQA